MKKLFSLCDNSAIRNSYQNTASEENWQIKWTNSAQFLFVFRLLMVPANSTELIRHTQAEKYFFNLHSANLTPKAFENHFSNRPTSKQMNRWLSSECEERSTQTDRFGWKAPAGAAECFVTWMFDCSTNKKMCNSVVSCEKLDFLVAKASQTEEMSSEFERKIKKLKKTILIFF